MQSKRLAALSLRRLQSAHKLHSPSIRTVQLEFRIRPPGSLLSKSISAQATRRSPLHPSLARYAESPPVPQSVEGEYCGMLDGEWQFPEGWVDGHHPDDLKLVKEPLKPQFYYDPDMPYGRLWFRTSFKVNEGFLPASFVVVTGASGSLYLTPRLTEMLKDGGRISDGRMSITGSPEFSIRAPPDHCPANINIIGVGLVKHLGLQFDETTSQWQRNHAYW